MSDVDDSDHELTDEHASVYELIGLMESTKADFLQ